MIDFLKIKNIEDLKNESEIHPVIIFKHSLTCHISSGAYKIMKKYLENKNLEVPVYLVVVQEERGLSNKISEDFGIKHESPQILIIKNRKVVYYESHNNIKPDNFKFE